MGFRRFVLSVLFGWAASFQVSALDVSVEEVLSETGVTGGLIVCLGCDTPELITGLHGAGSFLVHGLDVDMDKVRSAREHIHSLGLYGQATADLLSADRLPFIDNVANLIIGELPEGISKDEVMRILAPGGVAYVQRGSGWTKTRKSIPGNVDEWTHYLHGPDNNAVSGDEVLSYPYHMQWAGNPVWTRNHNHLNGYSAVVTSGGRVFYILDEGPIQSVSYTPKWVLAARDAHNGIVLWKKPISRWEGHLRRFRSGPVELPRRLVAVGERVFVTLGYGEPLSILDAATGEVLHTAEGTEGTHEVIHSGDVLYLVAGRIDTDKYRASLETGMQSPPIRGKRIIAVSAETGKKIWEKSDNDTREMLPTTLCADSTRLYFQGLNELICLDRKSGEVVWRVPRRIELKRKAWSSPTLVVYEDVVLCAEGKFATGKGKGGAADSASGSGDESLRVQWEVTAKPKSSEGGELIAFSVRDGRELWRCPAAFGYTAPPNLFVADGLVWVNELPGINTADMTKGRDPRTGEVKRQIDTSWAFDCAHHHRCYRDKATNRFLLFGRTGVEFVDIRSKEIQRHFWIRGTCQYGVMPANGLLYLPGHSCGCYIQSKLNGFWAVAPERESGIVNFDEDGRVARGPAWGAFLEEEDVGESDWPVHRHDNGRTGSTAAKVPGELTNLWSTELGENITPPVIAGGKVLLALKDKHIVTSLDAENGDRRWSFSAGGAIDSPPTVSKGLVVFGAHDGFVYCLRLSDGKLVWRFRAAPEDKRTVAFGQVESVWPVVGSVSVVDDTVYCVAGRSSYLDGGMGLFRLDLRTGREIGRTWFDSRDSETGEQPDELLEDVELPGALPDILTFDRGSMFLRDKQFDLDGKEKTAEYRPHLYSSAGLLNPEWWHRTIWIWGERAFGRASGWAIAGRYRPSGRLLTVEGPLVYGYEFADIDPRRGRRPQDKHLLFCADKKVKKVDRKIKNNNPAVTKYMTPDQVVYHWKQPLDFAVRGMVKADEIIFVSGPGDAEEICFDDSAESAVLAAFKAADGSPVSQIAISSQPVFDGMAAAGGCLYLSMADGTLACYGEHSYVR